MADRLVVIEKECEHGQLGRHRYPEPPPGGWLPGDLDLSRVCPGGSRRVLDPGEYVLIEKAEDQEWRDEDADKLLQWAIPRLRRYESHSGGRYRQVEDCAEDLDFMMGALDALAGEQP